MHDEAEHAGPAEKAVPAPGRRGLRGRLRRSPAGQSEERAPAATPAAAARLLLARAVTRLLREKVAHIEGPRGGRAGRGGKEGPRGGLRRRRGRPLAWQGLLPAAGSPALRTRHTRRRRGRGRREGGRQLRAARVARRGLHAWPPGAGRTMGASCGDAREGAGLPAGPAGSVSQSGSAAPRRGRRRPASDHFNSGSAGGARARDTTRCRRSARLLRHPSSGRGRSRPRGRAGAHPGRA